jgi:hypothetical protein
MGIRSVGRVPRLAALSCLALFALAGCAGPQREAQSGNGHTPIRRVALLEAAGPSKYELALVHHPASVLGVVGGVALAAERVTKTDGLNRALGPFNYHLPDDLTAQLAAELERANFVVERVRVERASPALLESYVGLGGDADAIIDAVVTREAYFANTREDDYRPSVGVSVRVFVPRDDKVLYAQQFGYGTPPRFSQERNFASAGRYAFANYEAVVGQPAEALAGLKSAVPVLAREIVASLPRQ